MKINLKSKHSNSRTDSLFDRIMPSSVRSQSEVVSTVLLILIAIIAITIVGAFAINFVKNQMEKSKCFEVLDLIEISNSNSYTCYDGTNKFVLVQIQFLETKSLLDGFAIELGGADTNSFKILNNVQVDNVVMYSGNSQNLVLPADNTEKTYKISGISSKPDTLKVYPILKGGRVCQGSSSQTQIPLCPTVTP